MSVPDNPDLRDFFAAHALTAVLNSHVPDTPGQTYSEAVAVACFRMADAMIAERAKTTI